ncbi:MAG: hypothetical protein J4452_01210 [Candidatus Aenigmarchaeota archaeon]|nr:hypothetical protein [Candidatus Aenigmarchaeota archaeon]
MKDKTTVQKKIQATAVMTVYLDLERFGLDNGIRPTPTMDAKYENANRMIEEGNYLDAFLFFQDLNAEYSKLIRRRL